MEFLRNETTYRSKALTPYPTMPGSPQRSSLQNCARHWLGNPALSIGFHILSCILFLFPKHTKPAPTTGLNFHLFPVYSSPY